MKKLLADKPTYQALRAVSAPTSPLRLLLESMRDETMLTRERPKPANAPKDAKAATIALLRSAKSITACAIGAFRASAIGAAQFR